MKFTAVLAAIAMMALAADAQATSPQPSPGSHSDQAASAAQFDGTYDGVPEGIGCPTSGRHLKATIASGTFFMLANPKTSLAFQGPVEADGAIAAAGTNGSERLTGRVANGIFEGTTAGLKCNAKLVMRRTSNSPEPSIVRESTMLIQMCGVMFMRPAVSPPPPGTPANVAAFLGQWGDCNTEWIYQSGYGGGVPYAMFVTAVSPDGTAEILTVHGAHPAWNYRAGVYKFQAKIASDKLHYTAGDQDTYVFNRYGNTLYGADTVFGTTVSLLKQ